MKKDESVVNKDTEKLQKQIDELNNNWKRALADYQNLERRARNEKEEFAKYAKSSLVTKLLPVVDSLEKAQVHLKDQALSISVKTLKSILGAEGLEEIDVLGKHFDPYSMQAIDVVYGKDEGKVVEVFQKGYRLFNKVIRPAQVKVTKIFKKEE